MQKPHVSVIAAIGQNRALGKDNRLLWHIPDDLKRFHRLTLGHPVIMGRKTFESIVSYIHGPLPGRENIVITRGDWKYEGVHVAHSVQEALEIAQGLDSKEIFIGGGADIYAQALPYADKLYITLVELSPEADTFFPPYEKEFPKIVFKEEHEHKGTKYSWVDLEK